MMNEVKEKTANSVNELRALMRDELLKQAQNLNSTMQHVINDSDVIRKQVEEIRMNGLSLDSKCKQMVNEVKEITANSVNELRTNIQELKVVIVCIVLSLLVVLIAGGLNVYLNSEIPDDRLRAQEVLKHAESIEFGVENDEWIKSEITDLNQQVDSLVLPLHRMLLSKRQGNYIVSAPFYTEDQGYRMRALAYPRNDIDKMIASMPLRSAGKV